MASQHFEQFTANLDYARNMVVGGQALAGLRTVSVDFGALSAAHPEDLYRAAWSQAVSALDHWLHMEIRDHAVALVASTNRPLPDRLAKLRLPLEMVEEMAEDSKATVFGEFVSEEIRRDTYQRSKGITEGLRLVSELKADQIWAHIGAGRGMNAGQARHEQDAIADRRNRIAHRADLGDDGERTPMSAADVDHAIQWIAYVAERITELFPQAEDGGELPVPQAAWLVRSGQNGERDRWALEGNRVGSGFIEVPDLSAVDSRERMREVVEESYAGSAAGRITNFAGQLWAFRGKISVGDLVVLPLKRKSQLAIGRVTGDYAYDADAPEDRRHYRRVEWLRTDVPRKRVQQDLLNSLGAFMTVCELWKNDAAWRLAEIARTGEDPGPRTEEG